MAMQIKMFRPANSLKVRDRIIQLVAINVMNINTFWYGAMIRFPYHMSAKSPFIRRSNFHISALLFIPLVPGSYSDSSNGYRVMTDGKLTACVSFHSLILTHNYTGDKCRY